jgi:hypothetical protein
MSFTQKDRLDRIQHTLLPTTEKNFIENNRKMPIFYIFFGRQQLMLQPNISVNVHAQMSMSKCPCTNVAAQGKSIPG